MGNETWVKADGRTTCCGAFTSIGMDDEVEYCKKCFNPVEGHLHVAEARPLGQKTAQ